LIKEKLYIEELTILEFKFWDLCIQKILRNFTSMKFLIFIFIYWISVWGLVKGKIDDKVFASIVISGLVVIASARVYADTKLNYDDSKYKEEGEEIKRKRHSRINDDEEEDLYEN